jgi:nitroreductase
MQFEDVVRKRKMVRSFTTEPIVADAVERILRNAQRAPSAGHSQGWAFLVFEGPAQTHRFWDVVWPGDEREQFGWPALFNAPLVVVCVSEKDTYLDRYAEPDKGWSDRDEKRWPVPFWDIDTAMAAMLILLTAVDEGLGALFFGVRRHEELKTAYGVPARATVIGAIAIGHPAPDRPSPSLARGKRAPADVIHRGGW